MISMPRFDEQFNEGIFIFNEYSKIQLAFVAHRLGQLNKLFVLKFRTGCKKVFGFSESDLIG